MLPPPSHNFILFELDFYVKFPLLRLLQFLSDLKSTVLRWTNTFTCCWGGNPSEEEIEEMVEESDKDGSGSMDFLVLGYR